MKEDIKYPCICEFTESGTVMLMTGAKKGVALHDLGPSINSAQCKNITRAYLGGTYGKISSSKHGFFIRLMCEKHGITVNEYPSQLDSYFAVYGNELLFFHNGESASGLGGKLITIPMPPKEVEEVDEWPKVGDEVLIDTSGYDVVYGQNVDGLICKVLSIFKDDDTTVYAVNRDGVNYCFVRGLLRKPKTPEEELRDDIIELTLSHMENISHPAEANAYYLFSALIDKYNITKKQ